MTDEPQGDQNIHADKNSIAIGGISVGGNVGDIRIGHTIGFTSDQVSTLLTQISTTFQPRPFDGRCPYKGLDFFEEEDADLFFGRERLVEDLISRVKESRTVFITGPSGSGKSSLVRAGLIHALKAGALRDSDRWLYEIMKPGREPIQELSLAFSRLKGPDLTDYFLAHAQEPDILHRCAESALSGQKNQRFILFVDQFEEIFTQINQEEERQVFINMLAHAGTVDNGRVIVLFAMRSDFISNCATYPALNELISQEFRQIGAMQPEELVAAIALPAKEVGLPIEENLIARIINDMKGEPGALPLMQFALKDLFDAQQVKGGVIALTLEDYLQHGGIQKSLERHADTTLAALDEKSQALARSIFSGLIEIGRGTVDTKRTALFDELVPANASREAVLAIVQKLADARLIITDEQAGKDTVTISHEKLIEAWPWLKKLVDENRDVIALQNEIAGDAKEWDDHQRDASYLYSGARLVNANEQLKSNKLILSGTASEYIQAGQARRQRNRATLVAAISGIIGLLFLGVIVFSSQSRNNANIASTAQAASTDAVAQKVTAQAAAVEAQKQAHMARAGELAAQSIEIREKNFQISLLLGIEAFRSYNSVRARGVLLDVTTAHPQLLYYLIGHAGFVNGITFSPDGKTLASSNQDGTIILWDVETREPIGQPIKGHTAPIRSIAFSPDGKILASGSDDHTIILWEVETHQPIGQPLIGHTAPIRSIAFSPDGKTLASGSDYETTIVNPDGSATIFSGSDVETIILWDVKTHQPIGQPLIGHTGAVFSITFSPDGKILASGSFDHTIILWDVESRQPLGEPLIGHKDNVSSITFSPDGTTLASGSDDGNIILWNVESQQPIGQALTEHKFAILSVAFSPDGKTLVSGSIDETIILWNVATQQRIRQPLTGLSVNAFTGYVLGMAFSPDGKTVASARPDGALILWDIVTARQPIGRPSTRLTDSVSGVAFSADGKTLASGSDDGSIILWDVESNQSIGQPLTGHNSPVLSVAFSPDGKTIASGSEDGNLILWDVGTHQPIGQPLTRHGSPVLSVAFNPDSRILASGNDDGKLILWDVDTYQPIGQPLTGHTGPVRSVTFNPDGKTLASISDDGKLILWDVETHQPTGDTDPISSVAFSPDRKTVASGSYGNTIILWDVETRQLIGQPLIGQTVLVTIGHSGSVVRLTFSPDGKTLASLSDDDAIILWDIETRQSIGQPLIGHTASVFSIAFLDDQTLASVSADGMILLWNINPQYWIRLSCQRVGRNFTRNEWGLYFPNEDYRATCPQWPLEPELTATPSPAP